MKRLRSTEGEPFSLWLSVHPRAGKLIIQSLVYITILSSLLGLGGLCLHSALRMDHSDQKDSFLIRSLLRSDRMIRGDADGSRIVIESPVSLKLNRAEGQSFVWKSHRGTLSREVLLEDKTVSRDRFPFPAGTQIEFLTDPNGTAVLRIVEPSDVVRYAEAADGSTHPTKPESVTNPVVPDGAANRRVIEIQLRGET